MISFIKYRNRAIILFLSLLTCKAQSQNLFFSLFAGTSNYSGELQEKKFSFSQSNLAFGLGLIYEINPKVIVKGDFVYGKISAADKYNPKTLVRNLSFFSSITEFSLSGEYNILNPYNYKFIPYVTGGVALYDFSPKTKDNNGNVIVLAELSTEGQGFYNGRKEYKLRQVSLPFGGGLQWIINDNKRLGISVVFRKTFTDYLDDVSTTYVDEFTLALNKGQKAANIAYRGDELPNGAPYPPEGTPRGNPKSKDWYYFTGISYRVRINPKRKEIEIRYDTKKSRNSRLGCPKF